LGEQTEEYKEFKEYEEYKELSMAKTNGSPARMLGPAKSF
jgi:hypothetical protein